MLEAGVVRRSQVSIGESLSSVVIGSQGSQVLLQSKTTRMQEEVCFYRLYVRSGSRNGFLPAYATTLTWQDGQGARMLSSGAGKRADRSLLPDQKFLSNSCWKGLSS